MPCDNLAVQRVRIDAKLVTELRASINAVAGLTAFLTGLASTPFVARTIKSRVPGAVVFHSVIFENTALGITVTVADSGIRVEARNRAEVQRVTDALNDFAPRFAVAAASARSQAKLRASKTERKAPTRSAAGATTLHLMI